MTQEEKEILSSDIATAVNKHIANGASRNEVCSIFAQECIDILEGLAWLPQNLQEAKKSFTMAKLHLA